MCVHQKRVHVHVHVRMPWVEWFVARFRWIEWVAFFSGLCMRPFNRIDAIWLLLRLSSVPVKATEVLVLGGSVTAGGGVGNDPSRAWHTMLGDVKPTVHHKGAIDPSYFLHCTGRFVEHEYDAVLLDLGANMFDDTCEGNLVAQRQFGQHALTTDCTPTNPTRVPSGTPG